MTKKFILISPKNRTAYNFRGDLIKTIISKGYEIIVTGPDKTDVDRIEALGARFVEIPMNKTGTSILQDLKYCSALRKLFQSEHPDAVLGYTSKPVIYGSIAAAKAGVPNINALITGAGYTFTAETAKAKALGTIVRTLYKKALKKANHIIFQNSDDLQEFCETGLADRSKCTAVAGSGVNMEHFAPAAASAPASASANATASAPATASANAAASAPASASANATASTPASASANATASTPAAADTDAKPGGDAAIAYPYQQARRVTFFMLSRLLKSKGVREYLQAARMVKQKHPETRFMLLGKYEYEMQDAIPQEEIESYIQDGTIERFEETDDVRPYYRQCDVYVLPSYREGMPRTVLEAMAMGRPIITTDANGCRDTVAAAAEYGSKALQQNGSKAPQQNGSKAPQPNGSSTLQPNGSKALQQNGSSASRQNGYKVPVADPQAVADAMIRFIKNPDLIPAMGKAGMALCREKFAVETVNENMLKAMQIK